MAFTHLLKSPWLWSATLAMTGAFVSVAYAQADLDLSGLRKFRDVAAPTNPYWVQVGWGDEDVTIFVDDTTVALENDPEVGNYVGFLSRLDLPHENVRMEFVVGAHCESRYYLVFQQNLFDLQTGSLIESAEYPEGTSAPSAEDGTLIAYAIDYACGL